MSRLCWHIQQQTLPSLPWEMESTKLCRKAGRRRLIDIILILVKSGTQHFVRNAHVTFFRPITVLAFTLRYPASRLSWRTRSWRLHSQAAEPSDFSRYNLPPGAVAIRGPGLRWLSDGPRPGPGSRPRRSKPAGWRPNRVPGAMNRRMGYIIYIYIVGICWDAGSATFSRDSGSLLSCENSRGPKLSHTKGIRTAAEAQHTYPVVLGSDSILHWLHV